MVFRRTATNVRRGTPGVGSIPKIPNTDNGKRQSVNSGGKCKIIGCILTNFTHLYSEQVGRPNVIFEVGSLTGDDMSLLTNLIGIGLTGSAKNEAVL